MVGLDEWVGTSSGLGMRLGEARQWAGFYFILFYCCNESRTKRCGFVEVITSVLRE